MSRSGRTFYYIAVTLSIIGALNWGLVGLFEWNLVGALFGEAAQPAAAGSRAVYILVGLAGLGLLFVLPSEDAAVRRGERAHPPPDQREVTP